MQQYICKLGLELRCQLCFFLSGATMYDPAPGTGRIWLDNVQCTGTEARLINCPSNNVGSHNCAHSEDVGVTCQAGMLIHM